MQLPKFSNLNSKPNPEAELQKKIMEAEKEYKTGFNTLRDFIAPSALQINTNNVEVSGKLARSFFVLSYPRYISVNWLAPIIGLDSADGYVDVYLPYGYSRDYEKIAQ
jgi:hypothetical protein